VDEEKNELPADLGKCLKADGHKLTQKLTANRMASFSLMVMKNFLEKAFSKFCRQTFLDIRDVQEEVMETSFRGDIHS
jgi:hypothetical protein